MVLNNKKEAKKRLAKQKLKRRKRYVEKSIVRTFDKTMEILIKL